MKINTKFIIFCLGLFAIVGIPVFIRAATSGITYDEAFTYVYYAKDFNINQYIYISNNLANNHIINTILIAVSTRLFNIPYNELIIRLPNLIMMVLYFIAGYIFTHEKKNKYLIFASLVLNYYVMEFFGLGRGYGIATALIMVMLIFYDKAVKNKYDDKNICISITIGILACYANTVSILAVMAISIIYLLNKIKEKKVIKFIKRNIIQLICFVISMLYIIYYHFTVTGGNKPVFGETTGILGYFAKSFVWMFIGKQWIVTVLNIILTVCILIIVLIKRKEVFKNSFINLFFVLNLLLIIPFIILNKPFLIERCLIPFWPVIAIGICEILSLVTLNNKVRVIIETSIIVLLTLIYIYKIDITKTRDWSDNYILKDIAYNILYERRSISDDEHDKYGQIYTLYFYRDKILDKYNYDIVKIQE